jgi:enterochelin esterase-like enzyme
VLFDGLAYIDLVPTPIILENLLADGKIPPLVCVLIDSLASEVRNYARCAASEGLRGELR